MPPEGFARSEGPTRVGCTSRTGTRHGGRLIVALAVLLGTVAALPGTAGAVDVGNLVYSGNAYGTEVDVGSIVTSGPTALVNLGCTSEAGIHNSNTVVGLNAAPIVVSGTVRTTADTSDTGTEKASRTTAETEGLSLLNGLVRADLVKAVSTTSRDASGFHTSAAGSAFVNLRVGLQTFNVLPAPNTTIPLAGLGSLVLNEQTSKITKKKASMTVNMIHVFINTQNVLGIPAGTQIIVSHAKSDLEGPVIRILDGRAYGTLAKVGNLLDSGPTAVVNMPCLGTKGQVKTNEVLQVNLPNLVTTGTVATTAQGTVNNLSASGETTATVEGVNLLAGLVTATLIKADAHASFDGVNFSFSDAGSTFVNLSVAGFPEITADTPPNTKLELAGLGTLWLHRVIQKPNSIEVRMIELIITDVTNIHGLPLGARVQVAVAEASVH